MTDKALVNRDHATLDIYGEIEAVRALTERLLVMLPGAKDLGPAGAGALAQASLMMDLNPFIGELWAIPQGGRQKDGTYASYAIMVGIKGLRAKAHAQAKADRGMYVPYFRIPRGEEIEGLKINPGDIVRACDITVSGDRATRHREFTGEVPRYTGIGLYRNGEKTKMSPLAVARKRAEADAIKQAFDVPLSFVSGGVQIDEIEDMPERFIEHEDNLVNGASRTADDAIDELFGDYTEDEPTGDPFLNGVDVGHTAGAEEAERKIANLEGLDLDYTPDWLDDEEARPGMWWGKLYRDAAQRLGFDNDHHVTGALAKATEVAKWDIHTTDLGYRSAWILLQDHQRSKRAEGEE